MSPRRSVKLEINDGRQATGEIETLIYDSKTRMMRAVKSGVGCLLAAFACVFIPVLHFVLVPSLLIAAIFLPAVIHRQEGAVLDGSYVCPGCQKKFSPMKANLKWPLKDTCPSCFASVSITLQPTK